MGKRRRRGFLSDVVIVVVIGCLASLLLPAGAAVSEETPQVLQPDSAAFNASERAVLLQELAQLETILASTEWGSRVRPGEQGWTSYEFALYTAGTLEGLGYETVVVTAATWSGGPHTWVLVGVSVGDRLAWIPVEATTASGSPQWTLGFVPKSSSHAGRFDERYAAFDQVVVLPANSAPTASIRHPMATVLVGEPATFFALSSHDPDGEIILYRWRIDGSRPTSGASNTYYNVFDSVGRHTVELTVVDNRGGRASEEIPVDVYAEEPEDGGGTNCGCGG